MNESLALEAKPLNYQRYPILLKDGSKFYLSEKEKLICETFIRTAGNLAECARVVNAKFKRKHSSATIKTWINTRRLISRYLEEKGDKRALVDAFNEEAWKLKAINHFHGTEKMDAVDVQLWRDWGKFEVHRGEQGGMSNNIQINVLQADGSK